MPDAVLLAPGKIRIQTISTSPFLLPPRLLLLLHFSSQPSSIRSYHLRVPALYTSAVFSLPSRLKRFFSNHSLRIYLLYHSPYL
ncbi:hypothetical protein VN97_g2125 [Penicillium thymicola]|uniref:Uncharacterized protein n=1 Tax=Penicillium thymicola TaxID=293382 RepID=A0AAI9TQR1_PENTH|nr:hypothetical protein VN97_g2125 [Penicillium thymicola]